MPILSCPTATPFDFGTIQGLTPEVARPSATRLLFVCDCDCGVRAADLPTRMTAATGRAAITPCRVGLDGLCRVRRDGLAHLRAARDPSSK